MLWTFLASPWVQLHGNLQQKQKINLPPRQHPHARHPLPRCRLTQCWQLREGPWLAEWGEEPTLKQEWGLPGSPQEDNESHSAQSHSAVWHV